MTPPKKQIFQRRTGQAFAQTAKGPLVYGVSQRCLKMSSLPISFFTPTMSSKGEGKLKNPDPSEGSSYRASSESEDVPIALEKRGVLPTPQPPSGRLGQECGLPSANRLPCPGGHSPGPAGFTEVCSYMSMRA